MTPTFTIRGHEYALYVRPVDGRIGVRRAGGRWRRYGEHVATLPAGVTIVSPGLAGIVADAVASANRGRTISNQQSRR